jgi:hypothetical protein
MFCFDILTCRRLLPDHKIHKYWDGMAFNLDSWVLRGDDHDDSIPAKDRGTSRQIPTAAGRNLWPEKMLEKLMRYLSSSDAVQ